MFTIIENYKKLFMMGVQLYVDLVDSPSSSSDVPDVLDVPDTPEGQALAEAQAETQEAVRKVTREQLQDLKAVVQELTAGKSIDAKSPTAAVKDIQEIFVFLGKDIGTFGPNKNGVDGDYGSTMKRVVSAFQTEKGLTATGSVDKATYDALLTAVGIQQDVPSSPTDATQKALAEAQAKAILEAQNLEAARAKVAQELAEREAAIQALDTNTAAITSSNEELTTHTQELSTLESELSTLQSRLASAEALEARSATYDAAQDTFTAEQAKLKEIQTNLEATKAELAQKEAALKTATETYQAENAQAQEAQEALTTAQAAFDAMQFTGDINSIPSVVSAQDAFKSTQTALQEAEKIMNDSYLPNFYTGYKEKVEQAQKLAQDAKKILDLAQAKEALDAAQVSLTRESGDSQAALDTLRSTTRQTSETQLQVQALSSDITTAQQSFETARQALTASLSGPQVSTPEDTTVLEAQVGDIVDKTEALRSQIAALEVSLTTLKGATAGLEEAVKVEQSQLEEAQKATPEIEAKDESARVAVANAQREHTQVTQEVVREQTAEEALKALDLLKKENGKGAIKAIQQALIDMGVDLGSTGADGDIGPKTRAGIEKNPQVVLDTLATYIDTTDNATNEKRVKVERPKDGNAIDAALLAWTTAPESEKARYVSVIASQFTGKGIDANTRNENAQYISLRLQELGMENNTEAQRLMERIMAEGKGHYEQETTDLQLGKALFDGSGRFASGLGRFPENFNGSYYKVQQKLQNAGGRAALEAGMKDGVSGNANQILDQLFGVHADYLATRMHVVTGQGKDGDADMSLELGGGIQLSNAYYDEASGAIYAVVAKGNGCEGNLVVIPVVPFIPPVPKPVPRVPTQTPPGEEPPVDTPDTPQQTTYTTRVCENNFIVIKTWLKTPGFFNPDQLISSEKTNETCGGDGGHDDTERSDTTTGGEGVDPSDLGSGDTASDDTAGDDSNSTDTTSDDNGPPGMQN